MLKETVPEQVDSLKQLLFPQFGCLLFHRDWSIYSSFAYQEQRDGQSYFQKVIWRMPITRKNALTCSISMVAPLLYFHQDLLDLAKPMNALAFVISTFKFKSKYRAQLLIPISEFRCLFFSRKEESDNVSKYNKWDVPLNVSKLSFSDFSDT